MVHGASGAGAIALARGVVAGLVREQRAAPRLVERRPVGHPVAEGVEDDPRVVHEPLGGVAARPAALLLERLGQVSVVQRQPGGDPVVEQLVDERR